MSRGNGKWYLHYIECDMREELVDDALKLKKVELKATDGNTAVEEAVNLWKQRLMKGTYKGWGGKVFPRSPRVVCEVSLKL